jgi:hypothetical protein
MRLSPAEIQLAAEWLLPLGVCCAEAQADGVPCDEPAADCLECERGETIRRLLLRMVTRVPTLDA